MNVISCPKAYQSAFRDACFVLDGFSTSSGVDVTISSFSQYGGLGVKRVYASGEVSVNAAPYIRRLLAPEPVCGTPLGVYLAVKRAVTCYVSAEGSNSPAVYLTGGSEDAPVDTIASASPGVLKIRMGETDELSVVTSGGRIKPLIKFRHEGVEYTDRSQIYSASTEMQAVVVNADDIGRLFTANTGAPVSEMTEFTISLEIRVGSSDIYVDRRYEIDRNTGRGRRLAWVNRYGAIDYYTFPYVAGGRVSGSRGRIYTPDGYRTVATSAETAETLLSEPCDAACAGWLSEIFSSPAVWTVDGTHFEKVEVAAGSAEYPSAHPATVAVTVSPAEKPFSRKY